MISSHTYRLILAFLGHAALDENIVNVNIIAAGSVTQADRQHVTDTCDTSHDDSLGDKLCELSSSLYRPLLTSWSHVCQASWYGLGR